MAKLPAEVDNIPYREKKTRLSLVSYFSIETPLSDETEPNGSITQS